jgi:Resolvase, N terminal domain
MGQVAIYCRVSTEDQSCERQERDLRVFAKRAGHQIVDDLHSWKVSVLAQTGLSFDLSTAIDLARLRQHHDLLALGTIILGP